MKKCLAIFIILSISSVNLSALEIDKDAFFGNSVLQFDFTGISSQWTDAGYGWNSAPTISVLINGWNLGDGGSGNWDPLSGVDGTFTYSYTYGDLDYPAGFLESSSINISLVFTNYGYNQTSVPFYLDNFWLRGHQFFTYLESTIWFEDTPDIQIESWENVIIPLDGWDFNPPSSGTIVETGATDGSYALRLDVPTDTFWHEGMSFEFTPEPASIALFGLGGLALLRRKK